MTNKIKKQVSTITLDEAEKASQEFAQFTSELNKTEVKMNTQINKIKAKYSATITDTKEKMDKAQSILKSFADQEKASWKEKSFDLLHCKIGFRKNPAKVTIIGEFKDEKTAWEKITDIASKFFPKLVNKTLVVQLNKKAIVEAAKDEKLFKKIKDKCQIDVVQDETFYVTAKQEQLVS